MKSKKIVVFILILAILQYLLVAFCPITTNNSFAKDQAKGTLSRDINNLDDNLYPGYKQLIKNLQSKHSNYTFLLYYTGIDWNEVLVSEYQGHGYSPKNLFQMGNNYNGMWLCPLCGTKKYDNGSWCCASLESLSYMMDPRNSINENDVFQFKDLEGSDVSYNDIARVVSKYGSFINNQEAIQAIVDASRQYNINGYFLVAKIINEHGTNGSVLSNGNGYNGQYAGCYNYFNIGSYGSGKDAVIRNGLAYAQSHGWTSRRASILGGTAEVRDSYMNKYSQNTFYYQKFNVSGRSTMASHQYQQNIMAAQSQGSSLKSYYTSNVNHVFIIPLYKNMPQNAAGRPNVAVQNKITYEEGIVQNISSSLKVRASANGTAIGALNNNEPIKIIKRAGNQVGGYYWDLIASSKDGTYGYAARATSGQNHLVSTGTTGSSGGTAGSNNNNNNNQSQQPPTSVDNNMKVAGLCITVLPNVTCENIKTKYKDAVIKNSSGTVVSSGNLGTGFTVTTGGKNYIIVKKGDTNGDGLVTVVDAVTILNAVKGNKTLVNAYKEAASVKDGKNFTVTDAVLILNYIKGSANITF